MGRGGDAFNISNFYYSIDAYKIMKISNGLSKLFCLKDDVIVSNIENLSTVFDLEVKDAIDLSILVHASESNTESILELFKSKKKFNMKKFIKKDFIAESLYNFVNLVHSSRKKNAKLSILPFLHRFKKLEKETKRVAKSLKRSVQGNTVTHANMSYHIERLVDSGYIITYERLYDILALWGRPSLRRRKKNPSRASVWRLINSEQKATPGRKPKFDAITLSKLLPLFLHKEYADLAKELSTMKLSRGKERNRKNMVKLLLKANKKNKIREFYFKNATIPDHKVVISKGFRPE